MYFTARKLRYFTGFSSKIWDFYNCEIWDAGCKFGTLDFEIGDFVLGLEIVDFRNSVFWKFRILEIWDFGNLGLLKIWHFGNL